VSASFNETFAYDGVNRLTGVVDNGGWSRYFAYDQYSNMWLCGSPGIAPNGSAPAANYCSQTPSGIFNTANRIGTGSYDAAGNQLTVAGSISPTMRRTGLRRRCSPASGTWIMATTETAGGCLRATRMAREPSTCTMRKES